MKIGFQLTAFVIAFACLASARAAEVSSNFQPPEGYHLVAEDNCGTSTQTRETT
jgi:hypothetical protein